MRLADTAPLWPVLAVQAALVLLLCLAVLVRGAWGDRRVARDGRRLAAVQLALAEADAAPGRERLVEATVTALPMRLQVAVLAELLPRLAGRQREVLALAAAAGTELTERAESWCRSRRAGRRRQGVRLLALLESGSAAPVRLLRDRRHRVRVQAVGWAVRRPEPEVVDALLEMVHDPRLAPVFLVKDSLARIGPPAVPSLIEFLARQTGARLGVGLEIAIALADPRTLPAALAATADESPDNRAMAATLAGALGGTDAVARLEELLVDPEPLVRAAAAGGLGACAHWPAAAPVARLLGDPAWAVRSQAGLALGAVGAPGILLLRRALSGPQTRARDTAAHVLDLLEAGSRRSAG